MPLTFTENRQRNVGLAVSTNPRTVLRSNGIVEATAAETSAGIIQHRYISPLRLAEAFVSNPGVTDGDKGDIVVTGTGTVWTIDPVTGTGDFVRATSPTLVTPVLGTPTSVTLTNGTGLPIATGVSGLGTGIATALAVNTGSAGAPVLFNGALGTPSSGTLTNATGLPVSTGISGFGTGVATALAVNVGSAGAFVTLNGALGTPSSGTLTNATGLPTTGLVDAAVTYAKFQNLDALSVFARSANSSGVGASVAAGTDGHVLRRSGTAIGFGTIALTGSVSDYEEGSWTPALAGSVTAGTQTYSTQNGRYIRIGNLVVAICNIQITTKDGATSGNLRVTGLPFTSRNVASFNTAAIIGYNQNINLDVAGARYTVCGQLPPNTTYIELLETGDDVAAAFLTEADFRNGTGFQLFSTYFIN